MNFIILSKWYTLLAFCALLASCSTDDVILGDIDPIADSILIPDPAFGEYLDYLGVRGVYSKMEGEEKIYLLNPAEVSAVTALNLSKTNASIQTLKTAGLRTAEDKITDLTGIRYFTGLNRLILTSNIIQTLDLSTLTELQTLEMNFNLVSKLDLSANTKLETLRYGASNSSSDEQKLSDLDLGKNTRLKVIHLPNHRLIAVDLSQQGQLTELLDLRGNPGPDGDPQTADILIPRAVYDKLPASARFGVIY